tara:strand:- start:26491 stop:27807 length:1317 start_codon:yes stop_codon:yes gene_type:complete
MGSTFTTFQRPGFGFLNDKEVYLQFVPGSVVEVVTSKASKTYAQDKSMMNSIIALPHISEKPQKETMLDESNRYKPLFRGMVDVPVKGDPVLLCTIAGVNYYLGPLNTQGDVNFNIDNARKRDIQMKANTDRNPTPLEELGISDAFPRYAQERLQKPYNDELDNPGNAKMSLLEIPGDMVFEGRFGNSLRLGSRFINPYTILSNRRSIQAHSESTRDGGLIFLSHKGSIRQHFQFDGKYNEDTEEIELSQFILADSDVEEPDRNIQSTFSTALGRGILDDETTFDAGVDIYEYADNQMLLASDRIMLNARKDSIFVSSFQYLHFGAGNTITFSTNNNFHISAGTRTVIDSPEIKLGTDDNDLTEPLVLGDQLVDFLKQFLTTVKKMNDTITQQVFATGAGPTAVGPTNAAAFKAINTSDIKKLEDTIEEILSQTNRTT